MRQKIFSYLLAAACAAALVGCTREPETQPEVYDQETEYEVVLTASLAPDTRGVSVTSEAVTATWSPNDKVALVYNNKILTALEVTGISGNSAQLSGKVYGAYPTNTAMTLYYGGVNADFTAIGYDYTGQDGTATEAAKRAYLKADVKIAKQENKKLTLGDAATGGAITLAHQQAYFELKFQYGPDQLKVRKVEVTLKAPAESKIVKSRTLTDNGFTSTYYTGTSENHYTVEAPEATYPAGLSTVYFVLSDESAVDVTYVYSVTEAGTNPRTFTAEYKYNANNQVVELDLEKAGPVANGTYRSGTWILDQKTLEPTKPQAQSVVYDAQPHELVTPGAVPYGEGLAEGAVLMYYFAKSGKPVDPVNPVLEASDTSALTPGDNAVWSTEIPVATEPGHYCVWYKVVGGLYFKDVPPTPVVEIDPDNAPNTLNAALIDKRRLDVTAPTAISNLKYTSSAQALVNAGTIKDKTSEEFDPGIAMQYCVFEGENPPMNLNNAAWSTEVPQAVNAGKYHIWYKVDSTAHYHGLAPADSPITVTIATTDAVIANPEPIVNLVYNGEYQQLVLPADASDGCKVYYYVATSNLTREQVVALGDGVWVAPADLTDPTTDQYKEFVPAPRKRDAGTYYIWTKVVDNSGGNNYSGVPGISEAAVVARIAPISITVTDYPASDWTYDGDARALMTQWMTVTFKSKTSDTDNALDEPTPAKLYYKFPGETSFTLFTPASPQDIATKTDAGSYTVQYYVAGGTNFENFSSASSPASFTVNVAQAAVVITGVTGSQGLVYNASNQDLLTNAGPVKFASTHPTKPGATIPTGTDANLYFKWESVRIGESAVSGHSYSDAIHPYTYVEGVYASVYTVYFRLDGGTNFISTAYNDTDKVEVTIARAPRSNFAVDITGWTYGQSANAPSVSGNNEDGAVVYTYKVQGADDSTYSGTAPTNAGNYTVRAVAAATYNYESATATKDFTIAKADPTLGSITVNQTDLVYDNTDKALITAADAPTGGTISGFGYYRSDATTASPVQPDTWYALADFKGHDAGYYYIFIKVTGDDNHNDKVFGPIDGSPKQIAKATGSVTLGSSTLHFASTDEINSTKTITVTDHAGALTCGVSCANGSTDQISVEKSSETTFTVTRKSSLAHVGTLQVLIIVSDSNYTQVQEAVTVTMDALPPLARVTTDDIGKFVQTDGSISSTANSSSVAMIAYVGNNSDCVHGVAISLADGGQGVWSDNATTWADGHVISNTPSGSTWRLPSQNDIEKMYTACNTSSSTSLNSRLKAGDASYGFTETGGSPTWYWTSTVISNSASIFKEIGDASRPDWEAKSIDDADNTFTFRYVFSF